MKQRLFFTAIFGSLLLLAAASCKKDDSAPPVANATRIIGSWKEYFQGIDSNKNGRPDGNEAMNPGNYRIVTFYANGSLRDTSFFNGVASNIETSYAVTGDYLTIVFPGIAPRRILHLDDSGLLLQDTSATLPLLTAFRRQ